MRALLGAHDAGMIDIGAGVVKWPHHVWLPPSGTPDRELLKKFLRACNPHTVVFSNIGDASHPLKFPEASKLIDDVLGPDTLRYWTSTHDTIDIHALLKTRWQGAVESPPRS